MNLLLHFWSVFFVFFPWLVICLLEPRIADPTGVLSVLQPVESKTTRWMTHLGFGRDPQFLKSPGNRSRVHILKQRPRPPRCSYQLFIPCFMSWLLIDIIFLIIAQRWSLRSWPHPVSPTPLEPNFCRGLFFVKNEICSFSTWIPN